MSVCCVRCKSVSKLPIFCNSCYQESFKSGERRGRIEELKRLHKSFSIFHAEGCVELKLIEKRIKELKGEQK
jgi:hypothetical protein